jgi:hypothetical protein
MAWELDPADADRYERGVAEAIAAAVGDYASRVRPAAKAGR